MLMAAIMSWVSLWVRLGSRCGKKPKALSEEALSNPKEAIAEKLEQHRRYKVKKKTRKMEKKGSKTIRQGNNKNSARENK